MWSYPISLGLLLIQKTLSLAYAPVPPDENKGSGSLLWTLLGVVLGLVIGLIVYKALNKSPGKTKK